MHIVSGFLSAIGRLWSKGCLGKGIVIFAVMLVLGMCNAIFGIGRSTPPIAAPAPTIAAAVAVPATAPEPTAAALPAPTIANTPTAEVLASLATDVATAVPTDAPAPAAASATEPPPLADSPVPAAEGAPVGQGVAPISKDDCPADHPVKGNIPASGDRIYHVPGRASYNATDPERCFATAADAEAAGFRAPR
jgi:hypothetical protein